MAITIIGKVCLQNMPGTDALSPDLREFHDLLPEEFQATAEKAQVLIDFSWKWSAEAHTTADIIKAVTTSGHRTTCQMFITDTATKEKDYVMIDGGWTPDLRDIKPLPVWPIEKVKEKIASMIGKKQCPQCAAGSFISLWDCPQCGYSFTDADMLNAEDAVRRDALSRGIKDARRYTLIGLIGAAILCYPFWKILDSWLNYPRPFSLVVAILIGLLALWLLFIGFREAIHLIQWSVARKDRQILPLPDGLYAQRLAQAKDQG